MSKLLIVALNKFIYNIFEFTYMYICLYLCMISINTDN